MSEDKAVVRQSSPTEQFNFFNPEHFATMQRACMLFAASELVPPMYRITEINTKEKAIANCMIAIETAQRIGASPLMVMQNMYIVYGQPAWSAKFLTATVNGCGRYNSIKYKLENLGKIKWNNSEVDNWQCIAYTTEKSTGEVLESIPVDIAMAIAEGWYGKKGSKWPTMPKLMLQYRSVTFWTRAYAPELSMGIKSEDEVEDYIDFEDVSDKVKKEVKENANKTVVGFDEQPAQNGVTHNGASTEIKQAENGNSDPKSAGVQTQMGGPNF
jgi:hypothetical protein